jgi:RNA-directed DNA polymerase
MVFTTLAHPVDIEFLSEAYERTRKDGAVGVDGQTAEAYAADLEGNLASLLGEVPGGPMGGEEPDASIAHVRIRGGRGRATAPGYPTAPRTFSGRLNPVTCAHVLPGEVAGAAFPPPYR